MAVPGNPHLAGLMERYHFSIAEMRTLHSGSSPWARDAEGHLAFDTGGRWRQVALVVRREITCERCGAPFAYTFRVVEESRTHRGRRAQHYDALKRAVARQLRRRIRCPHCGAWQQQPRRALIWHDRRDNFIGIAAIGGGMLGAVACVAGGQLLAGGWGAALGAVLAVGWVIKLTQWMLLHLLEGEP